MSEADDRLRASLRYILERVEWIRLNNDNGWDTGDPLADYNTWNSVLRDLHTLSEETAKLPEALKARHAGIPWREIAGFRNIIVHGYMSSISPKIVQVVLDQNLPELAAVLAAELELLDRGAEPE